MPATRCTNCSALYTVPDDALGKTFTCRKCVKPFVVRPLQTVSNKSAGPRPTGGAPVGKPARLASAAPPAPKAPPRQPTKPLPIYDVVLQPADPKLRRSRGFFLRLVTFLVFLAPIAGSGYFAYTNWHGAANKNSRGEEHLYGFIEVTSKAVNYTVLRTITTDGEVECDVAAKGRTAVDLAAGLADKGKLNPDGLAVTAEAARTFRNAMKDQHKVPAENIFVFSSGGLLAALKDNKKAIEDAKTELRDTVRKAANLEVDFVDLEEELRAQLNVGVPKKWRDSTLFIDVGNGGTRCGYLDGGVLLRKFQGPGVRKFGEAITANRKGRPIAETSNELAKAELHAPFKQWLEKQPSLPMSSFRQVYLGGGIVWVAATCMRPTERGIKVPLTVDDLRRFAAQVRANPRFLEDMKAPESLAAEERAKMEEDLSDMRKIFGKELDLIAGTQVLLALAEELELKQRELWFYRYGNIAPQIAYVLDKARAGRP